MRDTIHNWNDFPFNLPLLSLFDKVEFQNGVTLFIGENGTGKSTILEAIAICCGFNPEGGSKNFSFSTLDSHSGLHKHIRLSRSWRKPKSGYFLRAETFYNVASEIDRLDRDPYGGQKVIDHYGGKSLHKQSHGEGFMSLLLHRFHSEGLYILDEPEAALSPSRQFAMLNRISELVHHGSQFIIATHSPILMAYPDAKIWQCSESGFEVKSYRETDHYILMKRFLNDPDGMLASILWDEASVDAIR